jgi:hypothetical protein
MADEAGLEELANKAAERVREVIADAQRRADQIVREAEREATRIREGAEVDARERIESAKRALDELGGRLAGSPAAQPGAVGAETPPQPTPAEEPSEPTPPPEEPPGAPEAPTSPPAEPGDGGGSGDEAAARLVAMKMAVDGKSREEIDRHLAERFDLPDQSGLVDEILARVRK